MYIVGNKNDLSHQREVDFRSAEMIAKNEDCIAMETSAKEADNVGKLVYEHGNSVEEKHKKCGSHRDKRPC